MRIQLVSRLNGYGLSKDVAVLRSVLEPMGHDVHFTDWKKPRSVGRKFFHVNLFLELVNPAFFGQAERNYYVCNPEWTISDWHRHLPSFDAILAKTHDCEQIFTNLGHKVRYIGFTSEDRAGAPPPENPSTVLHIVGHSVAKGTAKVIEAARRMPDVTFTVIGKNAPADVPANVTVIRNAPDEVVRAHQNSPVHCQPSSYEGWGHVLGEARSVGALIVTTAAAPMDELITPDFGFGAAACEHNMERLALHKHVCIDSLVEMTRAAVDCVGTEAAKAIGQRARQAFLDGREEFKRNITELLAA